MQPLSWGGLVTPFYYPDLLILNFDGSDHQFVAALDEKTGKTAWQVQRSVDFQDLGPDGKPMTEGDFRKAFATPHVALIEGAPVLLSQAPRRFTPMNPSRESNSGRSPNGRITGQHPSPSSEMV